MRATWLAALCLSASAADARPYEIGDLLRLESYGQVAIDPSERWAIVERRLPYASAAHYDHGHAVERALSRLMVLDLEAPGDLAPLFEQERDAGYWSAGFSPSGQRLAVLRLQNDRLALGVLDMATRGVTWLPIPAGLPTANPSPLWIDDDTILYVARLDGQLPSILGTAGFTQRRSQSQWAQQARGDTPSLTILGSGELRSAGIASDGNVVVRTHLRTGASETIERGSVADVALSADRRHLAIVERGPAVQPEPASRVDPAFLGRRQRLVIFDLATGARREVCATCDVLPNLLSWSPSGADLLYYARRDGQTWDQGSLYRLGALGVATPISLAPARAEVRIVNGSSYVVRAGWAGGDAIVAGLAPDGQAGWYRAEQGGTIRGIGSGANRLIAASQRDQYLIAEGRLVRVDASGRSNPILSGAVRGVGPDYLDPYSIGARRLFNGDLDSMPVMTVAEGQLIKAVQVNMASGTPAWSVTLPGPDARVLAVAPRRRALLHLRTDPSGVSEITLARSDGTVRVLDSINQHLAEVDPVRRIAIHSVAPDGSRLTHWLTLPRQGKSLPPLVVIPYPGFVRPDLAPPPLNGSAFQPVVNPMLLASAGFAVLEPSVPRDNAAGDLAAGYVDLGTDPSAGQAGVDPIDRMTQIVLGAVDAATATGLVDPRRAALYGHSFGAYSVVGIASRTDRFSAVVAAAGPYDLLAAYGRLPPQADNAETGIQLTAPFGWFERGQGALGGPPWRMPQEYVRRSPLYSVETIRTPIMLIHGDVDTVPYSESERMFMALYRLGRDAILLRYAGEGHVFASPANIRDQWVRTRDFLQARLSPARRITIPSDEPMIRSSRAE